MDPDHQLKLRGLKEQSPILILSRPYVGVVKSYNPEKGRGLRQTLRSEFKRSG